MRWQALFDDLEAQLDEAEASDLRAEVADRTRREAALLHLVDRARAAVGSEVLLRLVAAGPVRGRLLDVGADWLLVEEPPQREVLVPLRAVAALTGLSVRADAPGSAGRVARRLDLAWALRGLVRDRAPVAVLLAGGAVLSGTLDRVGADHVDLAEHPGGEPRRAGAVRQVSALPLAAVVAVRSG